MSQFDFSQKDFEDSLTPTSKNRWVGSSGIAHVEGIRFALVYPAIVVLFLYFIGALLSPKNFAIATVSIVAFPYLYDSKYRWKNPIFVLRDFGTTLGQSFDVFVIGKGRSLAAWLALPIVVTFVFIERTGHKRHLPTAVAMRAFAVTAIGSTLLSLVWDLSAVDLFRVHGALSSHTLSSFLGSIGVTDIPLRIVLALAYLVWWLFVMYVQSVIVAILMCGTYWVLSNRVIQGSDDLPTGIVHVSDIHVTDGSTGSIEGGGKSNEEVFRDLKGATSAGAKVVVVSGDITDGGDREEWRIFVENCKHAAGAARIVMCPGNHDLHPYGGRYKPYESSIPMPSCLPRLRKIRYLHAVLELCPGARVVRGSEFVDLAEVIGANAETMRQYSETAAPELSLEIDKIWDLAFPMFWRIDEILFVALDTNRAASNLFTSALGDVSREQLHRLKRIVEVFPDRKSLVVIGHHHLYTPYAKDICQEVQMKYLQMLSAGALVRYLSNLRSHYLHGHRHVPFRFSIGRLNVCSAASLKYEMNEEGRCKLAGRLFRKLKARLAPV